MSLKGLSNKKTILHLSHTDVRYDSRILKELNALESLTRYDIFAFGVTAQEGVRFSSIIAKARILTIRLYTSKFVFLSRLFLYALNLIEITLLFSFHGLQLRPVVVHCHDTFALIPGVIIRIVTGCKLVYDAHELESNKNGQSPFLSRFTFVIEKLCWRWIDLLISVSDSILDWYAYNLGDKKSITLLNSPQFIPFDIIALNAPRSELYFHKLYDIHGDQLVFISLGLLEPGRGIDILLEAFSTSFFDSHLVFVGYGSLMSLIQDYCSKCNNIHLHHPVPHDQVVELIASADVGLCLIQNVSLSDYYCLPNKLFEYSFAGLHVLASDFPEIVKVVECYKLGTCCSVSLHSVSRAIQSLIDDPPHVCHKDLSDLSWKAQASRLVTSYRSLLNLDCFTDIISSDH